MQDSGMSYFAVIRYWFTLPLRFYSQAPGNRTTAPNKVTLEIVDKLFRDIFVLYTEHGSIGLMKVVLPRFTVMQMRIWWCIFHENRKPMKRRQWILNTYWFTQYSCSVQVTFNVEFNYIVTTLFIDACNMHKVENTFRILPPLSSLIHSKQWQ